MFQEQGSMKTNHNPPELTVELTLAKLMSSGLWNPTESRSSIQSPLWLSAESA